MIFSSLNCFSSSCIIRRRLWQTYEGRFELKFCQTQTNKNMGRKKNGNKPTLCNLFCRHKWNMRKMNGTNKDNQFILFFFCEKKNRKTSSMIFCFNPSKSQTNIWISIVFIKTKSLKNRRQKSFPNDWNRTNNASKTFKG